jgi:hypothetical protein
MTAVNVATPVEGGKPDTVDIKEAVVQIQPVTPELTPATTPEEQSPSTNDNMAGKKIFELEKPDDRARALAAKLTLEEQVRCFVCFCLCYVRLRPIRIWLYY